MDHKEKCKRLKAIRKKVADMIGVDLHQTECTFQGECKGTCPKCAKEEQTLNKAILGGSVIAASVMLSACNMQNESSHGSDNSGRDSNRHESNRQEKNEHGQELLSNIFGNPKEEEQIAGDMTIDDFYDPSVDDYAGGLDYIDPVEILDGEVEYCPPDVQTVDIEGDVAIAVYDLNNEDYVLDVCKNYSGAAYVEIDHYEDGKIIVHCYDFVEEEDGEFHTATVDWITVDPVNYCMTNSLGEDIDFYNY